MSEPTHIAIVTQPRASSGLGGYLMDALRRRGTDVDLVDALASKPHKLWPVLKSLRLNSDAMWKARWENTLFSSWAWKRNSRRNARLIARIQRPNTRVLVVSKEYFPHPVGETSDYDVFILYTAKLSLADGITPWLPPEKDREAFLKLETEYFQHARHIFTGGAYVKPHLVEDYDVDPDRVIVVGGGVHPYYLQHAVREVPNTFTNNILFVGWDFGMKGGADLLKAFAQVHLQRPDITLTIVGPDETQWLQQDGVKWIGRVTSKDDLIQLYRKSDLFVMPSLRDSFGFVFLEAMTQGVPCIGVDLNAMPEIIRDGETGYITPMGEPEALAAAILRYYSNSANRHRMGQVALDRVKGYYTWDLVVDRMMKQWAAAS